jgi:ABC-type uncharacterized transport system fused permease/ATPase subunit
MKDNNISFYNLIETNDYLLVPIANAASGAVGFGLSGAIAGVIIGAMDELFIYYNFTSSSYLSSFFQGISSFATLTSSWWIRGVGGALNSLLFELATSEYNDYTIKLINPIQMGLQGSYILGWKGFIGGVALGSLEEMLLYCNVYNKYYISTTISSVTITHLLKEKGILFIENSLAERAYINYLLSVLTRLEQITPFFLESLVVAASSVKIFYDEEQKIDIEAFEIQKKIKEVFTKLGHEGKYNKMLEQQTITSSGFSIVEQYFSFQMVGHLQKHHGAFYGQINNFGVWESLKISVKEILLTLPVLIAIKQIFINPIEAYFNFQVQNNLYNIVNNKWMMGETPLKILQDKTMEVLIDNLNKDIEIIANNGGELRNSFVNDVIKSSYSQYLMYQYNAKDLIVVYRFYYSCTQYVSEKLSNWELSYTNVIRNLESKRNSILKHDIRNAETVVERNGLIYSKEILNELNLEIKLQTTTKLMIKHLYDTWKEVELYTNIVFTFFSIAYKAHIGELDLKDRLKIVAATESVSALMSWNGKNARNIEEVNNSLKNLDEFISKINLNENLYSRDFNQEFNGSKGELILRNLKLYNGDNELFDVNEIILKFGKYYALTGDSGSGKSSLLSKIKGIIYNGIDAMGSIRYPSNLNINEDTILMSQKDFFPIDTTLLEAIYYPYTMKMNYKVEKNYYKILKMLNDLNFCSTDDISHEKCNLEDFLKSKKDWNSVLSGGQKKKALLVSVLIKEPKLLLLDEPFSGLNQEAIPEMQSLIMKTLNNNTLVICIDHHTSYSENFYDFELFIRNNTLGLKEFKSLVDSSEIQEL